MAALRRLFGAVFFFGAPVFLLVVASTVIALRPLFGPIDSENVGREQLVRLMQFRDFRALPPVHIAKLSERCDVEFGRRSGKMPEFRFSASEKKMYAYFADREGQSRATRFETNLNLLARAKYFDWMNRFDSLAHEEQAALMNEIVDDMKWWGDLYVNFLRAAELPIPSPVELMEDFFDMIESFKIGADAGDAKRIDRFKLKIVAGFSGREFNKIFKGTPFGSFF